MKINFDELMEKKGRALEASAQTDFTSPQVFRGSARGLQLLHSHIVATF
jgi:hypothetical protein